VRAGSKQIELEHAMPGAKGEEVKTKYCTACGRPIERGPATQKLVGYLMHLKCPKAKEKK